MFIIHRRNRDRAYFCSPGAYRTVPILVEKFLGTGRRISAARLDEVCACIYSNRRTENSSKIVNKCHLKQLRELDVIVIIIIPRTASVSRRII